MTGIDIYGQISIYINSGHISLYTLTPPDMLQTTPDMLQTPPDMLQTPPDTTRHATDIL